MTTGSNIREILVDDADYEWLSRYKWWILKSTTMYADVKAVELFGEFALTNKSMGVY